MPKVKKPVKSGKALKASASSFSVTKKTPAKAAASGTAKIKFARTGANKGNLIKHSGKNLSPKTTKKIPAKPIKAAEPKAVKNNIIKNSVAKVSAPLKGQKSEIAVLAKVGKAVPQKPVQKPIQKAVLKTSTPVAKATVDPKAKLGVSMPLPAKPAPAAKAGKGAKNKGPSIQLSPDRTCEILCHNINCVSLIEQTGYCRMHYIKNWQKIQRKKIVLETGKLKEILIEVVDKFPVKILEALRNDLRSYESFAKVVQGFDAYETDSEDDFGNEVEEVVDSRKVEYDESFE